MQGRRDIPFRMDHARRIGMLRRRITKAGLSSLLVTHLSDIRYLSGFTGSSAALAVTRRSARLFTDGRYKTQAAAEVQGAQVAIVTGLPAIAAVQWLAAQPGAESAGFDPSHTTVAELTRFRAELPSKLRRTFLAALAAPLVEPLRLIKDEDELNLMSQAALIGCELIEHILTMMRPGVREVEIAAELEYQARLRGAEGMSFETIVASGERSAMPHGKASTSQVPRRGFVTLDFGIIREGYCSDMTRTVCLGKPKAEERAAYEAVLEAQESAVSAVAAGVSCGKWTKQRAASFVRREWPTHFRTRPATESDWRFTSRRESVRDRRQGCRRAWLLPLNPECIGRASSAFVLKTWWP